MIKTWPRQLAAGTIIATLALVGLVSCGSAPVQSDDYGITAVTAPLPDGRQVLCVVLPYNKGISCDWGHAK